MLQSSNGGGVRYKGQAFGNDLTLIEYLPTPMPPKAPARRLRCLPEFSFMGISTHRLWF